MHSQLYPSSTKYYNFVCIWMTGVNSETWLAPHPCQALLQSVQDDKLWEVEVLFASFANYPLWRKHMRRLLKLLYIGQRIWSSFPCANQIHATPHDTSNHSVDFLCGNEVIIWFHKSQFRGWQITRQGQEDYVCRLCSPPPTTPITVWQTSESGCWYDLTILPIPHHQSEKLSALKFTDKENCSFDIIFEQNMLQLVNYL